MTKPPYEWPTRTTGPFVRCARNEATYGASVVTPRRRFGGVRTVKPWPCSSAETAFQLEPSAQAPWTSTMLGVVAGMVVTAPSFEGLGHFPGHQLSFLVISGGRGGGS